MNDTPTKSEAKQLINLAIGRIFLLGSRPTQPGDLNNYERMKAIIYQCTDILEEKEVER